MNNNLRKRPLIAASVVFLVWGIIFLAAIHFRVLYTLYLELSPNPWQPISSETYPETGVAAIDFVDSYHGWIGGEDGIIMSTTDGGKSWEEQQSGINCTIYTIDFLNASIGVAISNQGGYILVTHNGGVNWIISERAKYPTSSGWKETMLWDAVTCDEDTAWVLGTDGSFFRVNITNYSWTF